MSLTSSQNPELAELMKRDRKLQAIMGQRELTQAEKDEWENLSQQITQIQEDIQNNASESTASSDF